MYRSSVRFGLLWMWLSVIGITLSLSGTMALPTTSVLAAQTITCDDGSAQGIGGYRADSECAMLMQEYNCEHSDLPDGEIDTLTCTDLLPDEDDDGVPDDRDECPGEGSRGNVDARGCPLPIPPVNLDGYRFTGDRQLIFVNNPEQLVVNYQAPDGVVYSDLADPGLGGKSILRQDIAAGTYRNAFEHTNDTGDTIGYGVQIYNPGSEVLDVTIEGRGFTTSSDYAAAFVQLLNNPTSQTISVAAQGTEWLMLESESIPSGRFFSGVVDFTTSGPAIIDNLAFNTLSSFENIEYMGWIRRLQRESPNNVHEDRLYKGLSSQTDTVTLPFNVTIPDGAPDTDLTFTYPQYVNNGSDLFVPSSERVELPYWMTHTVPSRDEPSNNWYAISSDMAAFDIPQYGVIDPNRLYAGEHTLAQPNLGNWGITYITNGTFQNNSSQDKEITFKITAAAEDIHIAYFNGRQWASAEVADGNTIEYLSSTVEAGQSQTIEAQYILGMPSNSRLKNSVTISTP